MWHTPCLKIGFASMDFEGWKGPGGRGDSAWNVILRCPSSVQNMSPVSLLSGQNEVETLHQNPFSALLQRWFATLARRRGEGQTKSEKTGREKGPVKRKNKHRIVCRASKANQWVSRLSFWAYFEVYTGVVFFMLWTLSPLADAMVSHGRTREHGMSTEKSNKNNL